MTFRPLGYAPAHPRMLAAVVLSLLTSTSSVAQESHTISGPDALGGLVGDCNGNGIPDAVDMEPIGEGVPLPEITVPEGMEATVVASGLARPVALVVSEGGEFGDFLYVAENALSTADDHIVRVDRNGSVTVFATGLSGPRGMVFGPRGAFGPGLYVGHDSGVSRLDATGGVTWVKGGLSVPMAGITFGFGDDLFATDYPGGIDRVDSAGTVTTFIADDVLGRVEGIRRAPSALFGFDLFVADEGLHVVWRIDENASLTRFVEGITDGLVRWLPQALAFGHGGRFGENLFVTSLDHPPAVFAVAPDGSTTAFATGFQSRVGGIDFGKGGSFGRSMYLTELDTGRIVRIGPATLDCNVNGVLDECDINQGIDTDCNANSVPDSCEVSQYPLVDCDGSGVHDECEGLRPASPTYGESAIAMNRFLSFNPGNNTDAAIRVTIVDLPAPFDQFNGSTMWVTPPNMVSESGGNVDPVPGFPSFAAATLQCDPAYVDWSQTGPVSVYHELIVPGGTFHVHVLPAICSPENEVNFSAPLLLATDAWGDLVGNFDPAAIAWTGPDTSVDVATDVIAVLDKFSNLPGAPVKARCDVNPATPDLTIDITDATRVLDAFVGEPYPFPPGPLPCGE